jgi:hypothetical protein
VHPRQYRAWCGDGKRARAGGAHSPLTPPDRWRRVTAGLILRSSRFRRSHVEPVQVADAGAVARRDARVRRR